MQRRPEISKNSLIAGYQTMNARVIAGAVLGICLHTANFYFAPTNLIYTTTYFAPLAIFVWVLFVAIFLHSFGNRIFARPNGVAIFRSIFAVHAAAYAAGLGISCSCLLVALHMHPYAISVVATAMAASTVAVSTFSFDFIACTLFLNALFVPIIYTSICLVENASGIAGASTLCYFFFHVLAFAINRTLYHNYAQQETIERQALTLQKTNRELNESNQMLQGTIDSIDELFLVVDKRMVCYATPTERTVEKLKADPINKNLIQIFRLTDKKASDLDNWFELLISGKVDFEVLAPLGPPEWVDETTARTYRLRYAPLTEGASTAGVIVIMTDITRSLSAEKMAMAARDHARFILAVSSNRSEFANFLKKVDSKLSDFDSQEIGIDFIRRDLHDLKVIAGIFSLTALVADINRFELLLKNFDSAIHTTAIIKSESRTIRKNFAAWVNDEMTTLNRLRVFAPEEIVVEEKFAARVRQTHSASESDLATFDLTLCQLKSRSVETMLQAYNLQIQKVAASLAKKVAYQVLASQDTPFLLNAKFNQVFDSLAHIFNNAIDHGVEAPDARVAYGKPEAGRLTATAKLKKSADQNLLIITVEDDGAGISPKQIKAVATRRGLTVAGLNDSEICQLVFVPGFSTKQEPTLLSGQGIGLSALAHQVRAVGGTISVSALAVGTLFEVIIPVSNDDVWIPPTT